MSTRIRRDVWFPDDFCDDPAWDALADPTDPRAKSTALGTYLFLCLWSARHRDDGCVPPARLEQDSPTAIAGLVSVGLLEHLENGDGYLPRLLALASIDSGSDR